MPFRLARRLAPTLALSALLAACGGQAAAPPTAAPTAAATVAPSATAVPTVAPTATLVPATETPAVKSILPRALYVLQDGQIVRIQPDGMTQTQITSEKPFESGALAISAFTVSPSDNSLAYLVQRKGGPLLLRSDPDGKNPTPLFDQAEVTPSDPLFTPDGKSLAVRLATLPETKTSFKSGLYLIPVAGGKPQLLVADEHTADDGYGHAPLAFSPDGTHLLTNRANLIVDLCDLGVVNVADGVAVPIQVPMPAEQERTSSCGMGVWSADSAAVYFVAYRVAAAGGNVAIWRADPSTGESTLVTPEQSGPPFTLYSHLGAAADGSLRAMVARASEMPPPFAEPTDPLTYTLARLDLASGALSELRATLDQEPSSVLWAPDGSGAVAMLFSASGQADLFWLPVDGEPVPLTDKPADRSGLVWAGR
jgi:hypothetical protein